MKAPFIHFTWKQCSHYVDTHLNASSYFCTQFKVSRYFNAASWRLMPTHPNAKVRIYNFHRPRFMICVTVFWLTIRATLSHLPIHSKSWHARIFCKCQQINAVVFGPSDTSTQYLARSVIGSKGGITCKMLPGRCVPFHMPSNSGNDPEIKSN